MAEHKDKKKVDVKKKKPGFIQEMKAEMKRVTWPTRQKLLRSTAAVFLISLAFALLIWCVDFLVAGGLDLVGFNKAKTVDHTPTQTVAETTVVETKPVNVTTETTGK